MTNTQSNIQSVTVIIPTLNEEQNIDPLLEKLSKIEIKDHALKVLFVDDQSSDATVEKINAWNLVNPNISVLNRTGSADLTQAILDGVKHSDSDIIAVIDADLSHPTEKLPELFEPIINNTHDVTVGSRYVEGGGVADWPIHRRLLSWIGGLPARVLTDVNDTTSGFFSCRKKCFNVIDSNACGYKILIEMLAAGLDTFRIKEIPITFTDRTLGESKLSSKQLIQYIKRLFEISGAQVSSSTGSKFVAVGISGVVIDALLFNLFLQQNWSISEAHISSFIIAAISNYVFNSIWSFKFQHASVKSWLTKACKFIYIAITALLLRGAIIAALTSFFQISPTLAIYPAILTAAIVNYLGVSFLVFPNSKAPNASINWRVLALAVAAFICILRLLYLGTAQLLPDEAYYWNYTQFLDTGYLDHPPLLAWLIYISTTIFGDNEFAVRIGTFLAGIASLIYIFKLTALLFDKTSAYIAILLLSIYPFGAATGMLATTDSLQVLFWCAGLYYLSDAILNRRTQAWLMLGLSIGLGMLSKYTTAIFALSIVIYMLIDKKAYHWWKHPVIYISAILVVIIFSPNLIWNLQNDWSSLQFQTTRRFDKELVFSTHHLLLHIIVLLSPIGIILSAMSINKIKHLFAGVSGKHQFHDEHAYKIIMCLTFLPLSVFVYFSLTHTPRFHWTSPIWLSLIPLSAYLISPTSPSLVNKASLRKLVLYGGALLCMSYGALLHYSTLGLPFTTHSNLASHYFWQEAAYKTHKIEQQIITETGQRPVIICLSKWSIASSLRFYDVDGHVDNIVSRNFINETATMYEQWTQPDQWHGRPVLFVAMHNKDIQAKKLKPFVGSMQPIERYTLHSDNRELRTLLLRRANDYQPLASE